jgi:hypothetical protein
VCHELLTYVAQHGLIPWKGFNLAAVAAGMSVRFIIGMNPSFCIIELNMIKMRRVPYAAAWYRPRLDCNRL